VALSHKRDADARRKPLRKPLRVALVAGPLAVLATGSAVTLGVLGSDPQTHDVLAQQATTTGVSRAVDTVSRSDSRLDSRADQRFDEAFHAVQRADRAVDAASRQRWTTAPLNLWTTSGEDAVQDGLLASGTKVLVTGRTADGRVELVHDGLSRWVSAGYLAASKPRPEPEPEQKPQEAASTTVARTATAGLSTAPCPDGSVEDGLTPGAVLVYRAVCHAYPQITTYGGWDAHGEHSSGKAIDIMTSDQGTGDQIAAFLQAHASELHLYDVIWWDRIWTPERASEGWRDYGDHGSPTANHMDHVHVSVY